MPFNTYHVGAVSLEGSILRAVRNTVESLNHTLIRVWHSGRIQPIYSATGQIAPALMFDTPELGLALAVLTDEGVELSDTKAYLTEREPVRVGVNHPITSMYQGVAVPKTLSWDGGAGIWMLNVEVAPESTDGLASPYAYGLSALPAVAVIPETYTGGKLEIDAGAGDIELDCWQNATLDFGFVVDRTFHKGLPAPVRCNVRRASPSLRITNLNPREREVFGSFGSRIEGGRLSFRRNQTTAGEVPTRFPDASSAHVVFEFFAGIVYPGNYNAPEEGDTPQEITLVFDEVPLSLPFLFNINEPIA